MSGAFYAGCGELVGLVLASYGLIRESFATLNEPRAFGEGRFGEGTFGGGPSRLVAAIIAVGQIVWLLPKDGHLTLTDRKRNAALAIVGTVIAIGSLLAELVLSIPVAP